MTKLKRYSFAHITTPNNNIDIDIPLPAAHKLERDGKIKYDGKVVQSESIEHLFTPLPRFIMTRAEIS